MQNNLHIIIIICLCFILLPLQLRGGGRGEGLLVGVVLDKNNAPISRAIVKVLDGDKTLAFTTAKPDGSFVLAFTSDADSLTISAEKMSYAKETRRIANPLRAKDGRQPMVLFVLQDSFTQLKEVVVRAPAIVQKGDTLRFNLSAFLGKGDVSLEDALKKVPGITIDAGGTIKYNGKAISNFYVEGLEMLGGNYTLMTKNLPAEHVASVEVLENHNDARMDRGKVSDRVALNVRLKNSALLRPIGTAEAALGYSEERPLYTLGLTGMVFAKKFQATISAKTGNIEEFADNQSAVRVLGLGGDDSPNALKAMGELSGGRPPLHEMRYKNVDDRLVTANAITKLSEEKTLRVNASYGYHKEGNEAASASQYFLGGEDFLRLEHQTEALTRKHFPKLSINYTQNAEKKYVRNELQISGRWAENLLPTVESSLGNISLENSSLGENVLISQKQKIEYFSVENNLSYRVGIGKREWGASSDISWTKAPTVWLNISSEHASYNAQQSASSETFDFTQRLNTSFIFRRATLYFPITFKFNHNTVGTELWRNASSPELSTMHSELCTDRNDLKGDFGEIGFSPNIEYTSLDKRYNLRAYLNLRGVVLSGENNFGRIGNEASQSQPEELTFSRIFLDPSFLFTYTASAASRWNLRANYSHNQGDLLSLLTQPVMHNYRNTSARSGILARSETFSTNGSYDYKNPLTMWFASASANYSTTKQNLLTSNFITDNSSSSTALQSDNRMQSVSSSADLSKGVREINSKFTLRGGWTWNESRMVQQEIPVTCYGSTLYGSVLANLRPYPWMEANLSATWSLTASRYVSVRNKNREFDGNAKLSVFLPNNISLSANADYQHRQIQDGTAGNGGNIGGTGGGRKYKDLALFDLSATYKYKKLRFKLSANNLLDQRHYNYTIYSGLDTHSYNYSLRPREFVFSVIYTK